MSFLWTIVVGLVAGAVATILMPGRNKGGLFLLGISGSILAAGILYAEGQSLSIVASVIGATVLLALYRVTATKQRKRPNVQRTIDRDEFRKAA